MEREESTEGEMGLRHWFLLGAMTGCLLMIFRSPGFMGCLVLGVLLFVVLVAIIWWQYVLITAWLVAVVALLIRLGALAALRRKMRRG
jgi:hypothetical protein